VTPIKFSASGLFLGKNEKYTKSVMLGIQELVWMAPLSLFNSFKATFYCLGAGILLLVCGLLSIPFFAAFWLYQRFYIAKFALQGLLVRPNAEQQNSENAL
jgi:hypothetical protein